jgi:hypothetical protein
MEVRTLNNAATGVRLLAVDGGLEALGAEAEQLSKPAWVTLSWRGRVDAEHLFGFFTDNYPRSPKDNPFPTLLFSVVIFGPDDSWRFEDKKGTSALKAKVPEGANFIRLEYTNIRGAGTNHAKALAPDFIVWSRVDLMDVSPEVEEPDRIGVWATPVVLKSMSEPLAQFVSDTHIYGISRPAALDGVHKLLQNFSLS